MTGAHRRKAHLLDVAYRLFNAHGYHQTGIDLIMAESGVSKTTMYKYFPTKEALILEVLKRRSVVLLETTSERLAIFAKDYPNASDLDRINAFFDTIEAWIDSGKFFGCNFVRAAAEYAVFDDPIRRHAVAHKREMQRLIEGLLTGCPPDKRGEMAEQVMLVVDGAVVTAHVGHLLQPVSSARMIIAQLLEAVRAPTRHLPVTGE